MALPRELLLDPRVYEKEKELEGRVKDAIVTLAPYFRFELNGYKLPWVELTNEFVNTSLNPALNRIRAHVSEYFPFTNLEAGEEAGHWIHFKVNPLFGRYENGKLLVLKQLIECVGRFSGIVYAGSLNEEIPVTNDLEDKSKETHQSSYVLAERLYWLHGPEFLFPLSRMKDPQFKKLQEEFNGGSK